MWGQHIITESLASVSLFGALDISASVIPFGNNDKQTEVHNDIKIGNWTDTFKRTLGLGGRCVVNVALVWNGSVYILHVYQI